MSSLEQVWCPSVSDYKFNHLIILYSTPEPPSEVSVSLLELLWCTNTGSIIHSILLTVYINSHLTPGRYRLYLPGVKCEFIRTNMVCNSVIIAGIQIRVRQLEIIFLNSQPKHMFGYSKQ